MSLKGGGGRKGAQKVTRNIQMTPYELKVCLAINKFL
jgi:hypothetical protein